MLTGNNYYVEKTKWTNSVNVFNNLNNVDN